MPSAFLPSEIYYDIVGIMSSTAVVILNWNGKAFMQKFIPFILSRTDFSGGSALYVADNGSQDGSVEWLRDTWPDGEVRLICMDCNYGFTGGYNRAFTEIERSGERFDYYLLLNSDIEVTGGWLGELERFMDSHPRCGACAPKILSYDRRTMFEHAGACGGYVDRWYFPYCRGRILSRVEEDRGQYDTAFFAHMEEIDFCWRAMLSGWEIWVDPAAVVYHVGGGTLPNNSPRKLYLNFRNNLLMMYKNLPDAGRSRIVFSRMCIDGMIGCVYLLTGKISFFKAVIRAHRDFRSMRRSMARTAAPCPVPRPRVTMVALALNGFRYPDGKVGD